MAEADDELPAAFSVEPVKVSNEVVEVLDEGHGGRRHGNSGGLYADLQASFDLYND